MRRRLITVLGFAVTAAFFASMLAYRAISAHSVTPVSAPTTTVLVAARSLSMGALITDQDVRAVAWQGAVSDSWMAHREDIAGRGVVSVINKGEPFSENRLAPKGAGAGLASVIPEGMRAVAVRVDEVAGVSGFVVPGMRVDVLSSGTPPGQTNTGTVTRTVLQNIQVLSAGQNFERDGQGKPAAVQVVNLLVTPAQAETLGLASSETKLQLVLRNPMDTQTVATLGTSTSGLLGTAPERVVRARSTAPAPVPRPLKAAAPEAPKMKPEPPSVVEVIHGSKKETIVVRKETDTEGKR